jgi:hypothetical protein
MKQPNTHHIRRFVDRVAGVGATQSLAFTKKELDEISLGLVDLLLYQRELEQEIRDLRARLDSAESITVEMQGDKF